MTGEGGDAPTGVAVLAMVDPQDVARLAVDHGEPGDALHVTLGYAAEPAANYTDEARSLLLDRLTAAVAPFAADPFGAAVLNPHSDDRDPCAVVLVQSDELATAHDAITDALGDDASTTFPLYVPHVTIGYGLGVDDIPEAAFDGPVRFDRVVVSWAGDLIDVTRTATAEARDLWARGWSQVVARHSRPLEVTARGRNTLEALRRITEDSGDVPVPITPTLKLGQLDGKWAVIYDRRNAVEAAHAEALRGILDRINALDWTAILDRLTTHSLINPGADRAAIAGDLRVAITDFIEGTLTADDLRVWRAALTAALSDAYAEGTVTATVLMGDIVGIDVGFDLVGAEAKAALGNGSVFDGAVEKWLDEQIDGLGYDLGNMLAKLWEEGATREDLEDAITKLLGADRTMAGRVLDFAISKALSMGAIDTYQSAGLAYVDFVTAGDVRVCPVCGEAEAESPYLLTAAPQPAMHIECRCALSPSAKVVPPATVLAFVQPYALDDDEELAA